MSHLHNFTQADTSRQVAQKKFYVVWQGRETGVFSDWGTCKAQVDGFAGARYKSFTSEADAQAAFASGASAGGGRAKPQTANRTAAKKPAKRASAGRANSPKTWTETEIAALDVQTKIFTDGGCEPNPGKAGSGVAVYRNNTVDELWYGLYNPRGTNNTAELNALYQGLLLAQDELARKRSVAVFSDSKYSIQCVTQWAVNWKKNGWKKPNGDAVKNLEIIQQSFDLHQTIKSDMQVLHVNGHVGVEGNELADRMTMIAVDTGMTAFNRYAEDIDIKAILAMRAG